jgi:hypothetical protein
LICQEKESVRLNYLTLKEEELIVKTMINETMSKKKELLSCIMVYEDAV